MNRIEKLIEKWSISAIIFDLDGTLVNTLEQHINAFQILFENEKIKIPYEEIAKEMGRTPKDTLLSIIPKLESNIEKLETLAIKKEEILTDLLDDIILFEGAINLLGFLYRRNFTLCLASSTPEFNVSKIIKTAEIDGYFHSVVTGEDINIGKPNPEVFLKAAKKANLLPKNCLVIGDSIHDILAAKNAEMKVIVVTTGKHSTEELEKYNPELIIKSLSELLN